MLKWIVLVVLVVVSAALVVLGVQSGFRATRGAFWWMYP